MNATLEYWEDDGWLVGRLREFPAVMSQGESLVDLESNIRDAYLLLAADADDNSSIPAQRRTASITL